MATPRPSWLSAVPPQPGEVSTGEGAAPLGSEDPNKNTTQPPIPPQDTYKFAIEEYRFQALFNWSRTQYMLAFNAAVLVAGVTLAKPSGAVAFVVFLLGAVAASLSVKVLTTQHGYYRAARDRLKKIEATLQIPDDLRFDTTEGLGGRKRTSMSVNLVIKILLCSIVAANLLGIFVLFAQATA